MHKEASRIGDFGLTGIGSYLTAQMIPGVSSVANTAGGVAGALREDALEEIKERGHAAKSLIPGVGAYRQGVIARAVADESGERGRKQLLHEMIGSRLGNFGVGMAGAAGGAALAKKLGHESVAPLAVAGGVAGLVAPSALAAIVALSTKTRTKKEQAEAEKRNVLLNYIPGYGDYQYMKRLGRGYDKHFEKKAGDKTMHLTSAIQKQALRERIGDAVMGGLSTGLTGALIPGGNLAGVAGTITGYLDEDAKDELKQRGSLAKSLIPGVGPHRQALIERAVADESGKRGRKQLLHEVLGNYAGTTAGALGGAALGAAGGAALDPTDTDMIAYGAMGGAVAGAMAPVMTAGLLALIKNTRTEKQQKEHEQGNLALNYIPGVGAYNQYKRLGTGYDRYFEGDEKINKNAGDQSMGYLTEAITGQTSEPRKQAVRNLLSKQALEGPVGSMAEKLKNLDRKDVGPAAAGGGIESYDKKKEKKGKMKKRTKPMRKSLKQLKKQYKRTPYNPITKEAAGAMANVKSQALAGGLLGSAAGAGYQALENAATGEKAKLKDYIRSILIGGGIGAAGGAAVGAAHGSDRLDSIQDADSKAENDVQDALDMIKDVYEDQQDFRLDQLEGVIPKESADGATAGMAGGTTITGNGIKASKKITQKELRKLDRKGNRKFKRYQKRQNTKGTKGAAGPAAEALKKIEDEVKRTGDAAANAANMSKEGSDRIEIIRSLFKKEAEDKACGEKGHYCPGCKGYGESMTCSGCGDSCGCAMSKEASDRKNAVRSILRKEADGLVWSDKTMKEKINQPVKDTSVASQASVEQRFKQQNPKGYKTSKYSKAHKPNSPKYNAAMAKHVANMQARRDAAIKSQQDAAKRQQAKSFSQTNADAINTRQQETKRAYAK